ncbi:hypothetical protein HYH02_004759 [Chlamydomonas schloesseri]|uniref:FAD dependent oxidoreductase domain-containing protein n=1 Tax=Chlamydomonas schloesseri TaxID=2026947 RepID=A0A836B7U1_9CHLO|nr:hypothetical protein HYH02_004759 [Chlamydomonas schloesseri]|eukprot:KAG2450247.1 hypothetical protein HYH02_004759 [Chlamydomonas schloesseri]
MAESAAYWRGLQAQAAGSGYTVLEDCRTLDLGMARGGGLAGELLGAMQDATKAAGVRLGTLRHEELMGLFPAMKLDSLATGLLQPDGGVLNKTAADKLLRSLCERQGVLVRDRVVLRGWRDEGDHFRLRTSGALLPDAVSLFEVEQLLVAPEHWPEHAMRLFGAKAEIKVMQSGFLRCDAAASLSKLPVWRSLHMVGGSTDDSPAELQVVGGYPAHVSGRDGSLASMKITSCVPEQQGGPPGTVDDPWSWSPQISISRTWTAAHSRAGKLLRGVGPVMQAAGMSGGIWS